MAAIALFSRFASLSLPLAVLCLALMPVYAQAAPAKGATQSGPREPKPLLSDYRVRTIMYQPDVVFKYIGHYGYQSSIEFQEGEEIQTISMGDSTAWQMTPSGRRLFLKPIEQNATTNVTLLTNKRSYLFEFHAREAKGIDDPEMMFIMRFVYPDGDGDNSLQQYLDSVPIPDPVNEPGKYNFRYSISGPEFVAPIRIFDDGQFTYFEFRGVNADVPAFFMVDSQGNESIVNYRTRGNYIVVERVAARYTLRWGNDIVCVFNEGFLMPDAPGAQKPSVAFQ